MKYRCLATISTLCVLVVACEPVGGDAAAPAADSGSEAAEPAASETRTVFLNDQGRRSLGLVLEDVEVRARGALLEVPGAVELRPSARQTIASPLAGRVELNVSSLDAVGAGDVVLSLDAPEWRALQANLVALDAEIEGHGTWLAEAERLEGAHARHEAALAELEERWRERLVELERIRDAAGGQAAALVDAQAAVLDARSRLAQAEEVGARLAVDRADRIAQRTTALARRTSLLDRASTFTGLERAALEELEGAQPRWSLIDRLEVRAAREGTVDRVEATSGEWVEQGEAVLGLRADSAVQVHAEVLQLDLRRFPVGAEVTVLPAAVEAGDVRSAAARVRGGLDADPRERSAHVILDFDAEPPLWARNGLAVRVELNPPVGSPERVALPAAAVRRDGVDRVAWVEDPASPSSLILCVLDVVDEAGDWVWIDGPVEAGTRVVVRGSGRLTAAVRGGAETGGHFHADGTYHAESH